MIGALLAVALVAYLVSDALSNSAGDRGAHRSSRPTLPRPTTLPSQPPDPPAFHQPRTFDIALAGNSQWSLERDRLVRTSPSGVVSTALGYLRITAASRPFLALDPGHRLIWLVVLDVAPMRIVAFDSQTLRPVGSSTWRHSAYGGAAVNGFLYLANDLGVAEVAPGAAHPHVVPGLRGALGPVAADHEHRQLIVLDAFSAMAVHSYRHGGSVRESETRLPIQRGSVAVSRGRIWVGGFGAEGAMLYRLDPHTLQPIDGGRAPLFDPGVLLIAGGRDVIWARNAGIESGLLACLDADTGRIEQRFRFMGPVPAIASTGGYAVLPTAQGVLGVRLTRCAG